MRSKRRSTPLAYVVRQHKSGWQVLLGVQLLGEHASYLQAYRAAESEANRALERGQSAKIVIGPVGGVRVEFPVMEPARSPSASQT